MPLSEVEGNAGTVVPLQYSSCTLNWGISCSMISIFSCALFAQKFGSGVKVYTVVCVLFIEGDQVPEMPFCDVVGSAGIGASEQNGPTSERVGDSGSKISMVNCDELAHELASGVKL